MNTPIKGMQLCFRSFWFPNNENSNNFLSSVQLELLNSLYFLRFLSSQVKCLMTVSLFNDFCRNGFTHIVKIMIISEVIFEFKKE